VFGSKLSLPGKIRLLLQQKVCLNGSRYFAAVAPGAVVKSTQRCGKPRNTFPQERRFSE
jgi:hypothetical protein